MSWGPSLEAQPGGPLGRSPKLAPKLEAQPCTLRLECQPAIATSKWGHCEHDFDQENEGPRGKKNGDMSWKISFTTGNTLSVFFRLGQKSTAVNYDNLNLLTR